MSPLPPTSSLFPYTTLFRSTLDIGGTKLLAAVAGDDLRPQRTVRRATPPDDPAGVLSAMLDEARDGASLRAIAVATDRKSTRLNSSHANSSYAVFCLKKKKT